MGLAQSGDYLTAEMEALGSRDRTNIQGLKIT